MTAWRHRWMIAGLWAAVVLVTLVVTLLMPRIYESTASIIAPKEVTGSGFLGGIVAATSLLQQTPGASTPSLTPNRDLLVSVLKSRTVAEATVQRFKLQERYRAGHLEDAIDELRRTTTVSISKEGVISVRTEDTDPKIAADMANFYVEMLDRLIAQYGIGEAGRQRVFLTEQVARARVGLDAAEQELKNFEEQNRAIVLQDQTRGAIEAAARLKGEIMAAQVQLQVMQSFATEANPEMVALRRRIDAMNRQLGQMQYGDGSPRQLADSNRERKDFTVPFSRVPEVGLELARLTRDVKIQETLVTLLTQQVEQARIAEAKDTPVVQILDRAVPAVRRAKPRLFINLLLASIGSIVAGILLAGFIDYTRGLSRVTTLS
jgi:tyrosine-protein kinase Etk/Wzc